MKTRRWILLLTVLMTLATHAQAAQVRSNPSYTVQYYAVLDRFAQSGETALPIIDTSGGKLPSNQVQPPTRSVYLESGTGRIITAKQTGEIYRQQSFRFYDAPGLAYVDQVSAVNRNYRLSQLWLWKGTGSPESLDPNDWQIFLSPAEARFTNEPTEAADAVVIEEGSVVRLVYEPTADEYRSAVTFYDYDITDGQAYADAAYTTPAGRNDSQTRYVKTAREGINSAENVSGTGAVLGFGNQNTGTDVAEQRWSGQLINRFNTGTFMGCAFGLATGVDEQGQIVFAQGVDAPALFGPQPAQGKTVVDGWELGFARSGDTYTLSSVYQGEDAVLSGLERFSNPDERYPNIYTNHFWPMDDAPTYNQPGHDVAFGRRDIRQLRRYGSGVYHFLPEADDGLDHNSYFGMSCEIGFTLTPDYNGPLEYMFFGDDDMWAFLDGTLICDIGGVHSSVGQYVDLWDYIRPTDTEQQHTLRFFYTERGASGSTCYMSFTLPSVNRQAQLEKTGALSVEKTVLYGDDAQAAFDFTVTLDDSSLTGRYGQMVFQRGRATFLLRHGEKMTAEGLPQDTRYTVTETAVDGYTVTNTGSTGVITPGQTASAAFVNTRATPTPTPQPTPTSTVSPTPTPAPTPVITVTPGPTGPPAENRPQTGDDTPVGWLMALAALSAGGGYLLMRKRAKDGH